MQKQIEKRKVPSENERADPAHDSTRQNYLKLTNKYRYYKMIGIYQLERSKG